MPVRNDPPKPGARQTSSRQTGAAGADPREGARDEVQLKKPRGVTKKQREQVSSRAAEKLLDTAKRHKDVDAKKAMEGFGKGDARVNERRNALTTLLSDRTGHYASEEMLKALGPQVAADVEWLKAAELGDYKLFDAKNFSWYDNEWTVNNRQLRQELDYRTRRHQSNVDQIAKGEAAYLDVSNQSVVGIALSPAGRPRADAMADALLQFRARTDAANQKEDGWTTRIDRFGLAILAEQRITLSTFDGDPKTMQGMREYALLREVIASHPISSNNGLFEARNAVANLMSDQNKYGRDTDHSAPTKWVQNKVPPGATASPYKSIHHNFSRDTPRNIRAFIDEWMLPLGPKAERGDTFLRLVEAMKLARGGDEKSARALLDKLTAKGEMAAALKPLVDPMKKAADGKLADAVRDGLKGLAEGALKPGCLGENVEKNLECAATTFRTICNEQPNARSLQENLFRASTAWPEVADVIVALDKGDDRLALKELGEARLAMQKAFFSATSGYERHEIVKLDAGLARLTNEHLGAAVDRVGAMKTDAEKAEALLAVQTGLRSAIASGLHAVKAEEDGAASEGRGLEAVLADVDAALKKGKIDESEYRALMAAVHLEVKIAVHSIGHFTDLRAAQIGSGKIPRVDEAPPTGDYGFQQSYQPTRASLDGEFRDQLIKQTPLHYLTALTQAGMRAGLVEKITPRAVENVEGMRVLNGIGPVIFKSVVAAENSKDLVKLKPARDALSVLYQLEEKKMVAVGGLFVDTAHAPGGNSHLNMYAMNNGIPVVALPELRTKYAEFFATAEKEGGIYVDDNGGEFKMYTVDHAKELGLIVDGDEEKLRPGMNRKITFLKPTDDATAFEVVAKHEAIISPARGTREVELYIPAADVAGLGRSCVSFAELATLGIHGRHLAGEKGTVLALLKAHPTLGKSVPDGSVVTTGRIMELLKETPVKGGKTLADVWSDLWTKDPHLKAQGGVNDQNFKESRFYKDADYRALKRQQLQDTTKKALTAHLLEKGPDGKQRLTAAGKKLYDELTANPALAGSDNWIARSSFTGEDRPGKSGAGQYESFPHLKDPVSRIKGIIGVVESTWMPEPVENNIADEINLQHIWPAVVVQHCLVPDVSGVMISRDIESGARQSVYFQLVKGFGGGVDGGKTTEGVLSPGGVRVAITDGEQGKSSTKSGTVQVQDVFVDQGDMAELRDLVLGVEQYFHEVVEKDKGHAVDMEVARVGGKWQVVQARVILMDK